MVTSGKRFGRAKHRAMAALEWRRSPTTWAGQFSLKRRSRYMLFLRPVLVANRNKEAGSEDGTRAQTRRGPCDGMGSTGIFARNFTQARMARHQWTRRLRIRDNFGRDHATLSRVAHRSAPLTARTRRYVESRFRIFAVRSERCRLAWRRGTRRRPARSPWRRFSARVSLGRWTSGLDLLRPRSGPGKTRHSSAFAK